ncbi:MAG: ssl1498 family light-harvesting-like protein [Trichodesmium sp. St16_bin4-tuft]|nr:ssl1498 family light-harvesting-like protein [Trichodesmium sp. MAG_R01]MDE5068696.1 ssl1498 family light-harvesting-like protein [Trichodesmium sp. St4_bin8_1]MDE5072294.1 ssl1498 family light-harvesting-like protein [Trichodesmium sp. St5_bin8]MDE5079785.1 ssl1498 family light-harvesting-like protein [Trichodesmium sp. St2_bin6]MDE5091644.1 ssl1498 family light-harvesting-like protein [Trichodesmium sp. St18_bin3_1_1]MDE5100383.1 ssl1498 family light-harvesting-like protein [Trichodesmium
MPYTTEEGGRLNNFAQEPKVYQAEAPDQKQQKLYLILGALGTFLIVSLVFVAFSVSA